MRKTSKRFQNLVKNRTSSEQLLDLEKALAEVKNMATAKFDETIEVALMLNVDPRHSDQNVRGMASLPAGTGKTVRIAVFAQGDQADKARAAGAHIVGGDDLVARIEGGTIDFDRCIATPAMMGLVGKVAKILGPKGLMPNPKLGTVTMDVEKAVRDAQGGQVEYRCEKAGIVHVGVGKSSFETSALLENVISLLSTINKAKPSGVKGTFMKALSLSSTMSPSVSVDLSAVYPLLQR